MSRKALALVLSLAALPVASAGAAGPSDDARAILEASGARGGLIVHLQCGDGRLTAALAGDGPYLVHGLASAERDVEAAREHVHSRGLYGRVSIDRFRGGRLPYAEELVNLVVAERVPAALRAEVERVLAPGGAVCEKPGATWVATPKARPETIDEWTHFLHGPDNNAVSTDARIAPPRHARWIAGPRWARSHDHLASLSAMVSSGGRVFAIVDEGPIATVAMPPDWQLVARDAFSGVLLWKRAIGPWEGTLRGFRSGPADLARRLVAVGDRLYVTLGYDEPVSVLDAATGRTVATYPQTKGAQELVLADGVLYAVLGDRELAEAADAARRRGAVPPPRNKRIVAVRAADGKVLWTKADADTAEVMPTTLAVAGGRVYFEDPREVVCLDAADAREVWRAKRPITVKRLGWSTPTLVVYGDVVLSADRSAPASSPPTSSAGAEAAGQVESEPSSKGGNSPPGELIAFHADTGRRLWTSRCRETYNAPVDVLVTDDLIWTGVLVKAGEPGVTEALDPMTGQVRRNRPPDREFFAPGMGHHRCYRNKATGRYLLLGRSGVEFIDLKTGQGIANHWIRGTCQYGIMPANGLLYVPPHSCACFIEAKLNSLNALAADRSRPAPTPERDRLERGPAYGQAGEPGRRAGREGDWPTYRHDAARSGRASSALGTDLAAAWETPLEGPLSSVTVAGGKVFVARAGAHTVSALDAESGRPVWQFTAGGRVDSPPTIHEGLALFGSADGCVYALGADDGRLAWRRQVTPEDRRVVAYGQLESAWPVHGSVLVRDGEIWCAAGRSSFLDGGIRLCRLDPATGKPLGTTIIDHRDPKTGYQEKGVVRGPNMPGALPDVLSAQHGSVYMRQARFGPDGKELPPDEPHLFSPAGFLDETWWHRTYWMVGTDMGSGWGGWAGSAGRCPSGRILALDGPTVYGYGRTAYGNNRHVGLGTSAYRLYAAKLGPTAPNLRTAPAEAGGAKPKADPARKQRRRGRRQARPKYETRWSRDAGVQVRAMVLAGETLFIAGPPEAGDDPAAALAAHEGRRGALLRAVSTADGEVRSSVKLAAPPVWDGMAVARGRLYLATTDGKVLCFEGK